jgi:hypothetical protein
MGAAADQQCWLYPARQPAREVGAGGIGLIVARWVLQLLRFDWVLAPRLSWWLAGARRERVHAAPCLLPLPPAAALLS